MAVGQNNNLKPIQKQKLKYFEDNVKKVEMQLKNSKGDSNKVRIFTNKLKTEKQKLKDLKLKYKEQGATKLSTNKLKVSKVSTPNRRLAKNESNIKRGTTMGGRPYGSLTTKKKVAKKKVTKNTVTKKRTVSKRSVNRAGQRYGQR